MSGRRVGIGTSPRLAQSSQLIRRRLAERGFTPHECPIDSEGENAWEALIGAGQYDTVVELDLSDLFRTPKSDRLTSAARLGLPQLIVPGGLDLLTEKAIDGVAKELAHKASAARGPTAIFVPALAWADREPVSQGLLSVFEEALRLWLPPSVAWQVRAEAVSDAAFADAVADWITSTAAGASQPPARPSASRP